MPEELVIMTIGVPGQTKYPSLLGDALNPLDLHTKTSIFQTDGLTGEAVFKQMLTATQDEYLRERRPGAGRFFVKDTAIVFYSREVNQPSDE